LTCDTPFLPYGRHQIEDDDIEAVIAVLKSDFLTTGPAIKNFENALIEKTGAQHAVACSSATAALHLATLALGLGPGDTVVVPSITFLATANAVRYVGADVIFADVDADTGLMSPDNLSHAIELGGKNVKAVFLVHLGGQSPDMAEISIVARKHGLAIVEDASHAIGGSYATPDGERTVGKCAHSDLAVFSFHPVKTVAMGEGGAITTGDAALADRLRLFRNHGMTRDAGDFAHHDMAFDKENGALANPWYYEMQEIGFNYRASDIHCALGLSQLSKLEKFVLRRSTLAKLYDKLLAPLAPTLRPVTRMPGGRPAWHLYQILIDFENVGVSRATLMRQLLDKNIGTQVHYIPVHQQPYYQRLYGRQYLPGVERFYSRCLSLPLFPGMLEGNVNQVTEHIQTLLFD
jgi:UDP-4-amino-4,6-dideoxy-N-acetyl-beta-L-altrosamine transaminase